MQHQQHTGKPAAPVVPPRNNMAEAPVDASGLGSELYNQRKGFTYQWASTDPKNPGYIGRKLHRNPVEFPDKHVEIQDAWQVVTDENDPMLKQGTLRPDQGTAIDMAVRNGSQVLIRTTDENANIATRANDAEVTLKAKAMKIPQKQRLPGGIVVTTAVSTGRASNDQDVNQMRNLVEEK